MSNSDISVDWFLVFKKFNLIKSEELLSCSKRSYIAWNSDCVLSLKFIILFSLILKRNKELISARNINLIEVKHLIIIDIENWEPDTTL